ncbi:isoleucine--tRNA ligase, mitochondrial-like [Mya arenaria]|uniref:isoleucine--tRNA ligase, mitochondrial-like n=1 Tax=Mya arenaria TaxID=6604 RepID=UPI0022E196AA|nr:isoleucine--tRNA ligase, mitochondrial-like [Mya arenaria]
MNFDKIPYFNMKIGLSMFSALAFDFIHPSARNIYMLHGRRLFTGKSGAGKKSKKYTRTLNLPKTQFPISLKDASTREKELQSLCRFGSLYEWQRHHNRGPEFILHDGPPYANGKPHVGHALNKVLKDIVNRYHVMRGHRVHYVPGWDCHGLPIELKALQGKAHLKLTPLQIRDEAQKFAESAIEVQMEGFKRWGVMADWDKPYFTFNPQYEAAQIDIFSRLHEKGYIYQDVMPVYWSPSSRTALAESELEYNEKHVSTSVYVRLPLVRKPPLLSTDNNVYAVIWTTTPWTLPANQALAYGENINYVLLKETGTSDVYICEDSFAEKLATITGKDLKLIEKVQGSDLEGATYMHPLTNEELPFLPGGHVTANKGTGLVHTAPSHGHDDFHLAKQHDIDVRVLVDDNSCYTESAGSKLEGKPVQGEATENTVLECLGRSLLHREPFTHSYPYDWRTKLPVIIRTSRQWFIDTRALHDKALKCLKSVKVVPSHLEARMESMLGARTYWCISRQRVWGVPIPVFYNRHTHEPLVDRAIISHIGELIAKQGSGIWWSLPHEELLPQSLLDQGGHGKCGDFEKGGDILDIWFDSGSSWAAVLARGQQADVYMEGTDQFGGWFQSSLLTSVALHDRAPYKSLVVHGFTMDEEGRKMSKSLGNVIDPDKVIHGGKDQKKEPGYGADVLRWWAAISNLQSISNIGSTTLDNIREELYGLRGTLRFLLGNVSCRNDGPVVEYGSLWPQDKLLLYRLYQYASKVDGFYENYEYSKLLQTTVQFCTNEVSKFYSTLVKDRCYCDTTDSAGRLSSLTAQWHVLHVITRCLAPVLPHLAEDLYHNFPPARHKQDVWSIFQTRWLNLPTEWNNPDIEHIMQPALDIRDHLHDIINDEPSVEFDVFIYTSQLLHSQLSEFQQEKTSSFSPLCELLQTASTALTDEPLNVIPDNIQLVNGICNVHMKDGYLCPEKYVIILNDTDRYVCERCRRFTAEKAGTLCGRCLNVLSTGWD